jgi:hypothetical protein
VQGRNSLSIVELQLALGASTEGSERKEADCDIMIKYQELSLASKCCTTFKQSSMKIRYLACVKSKEATRKSIT